MRELSLAHAEFHLHARILPVEPQRDQRMALDLHLAGELLDLLPMHEELAHLLRLMLGVARFRIRLDVEVVQPHLALLDFREGIPHIRESRADGFHLGALQHDASLVPCEDVKIAQRLAVDRNVATRAHASMLTARMPGRRYSCSSTTGFSS